MPKDIDREARLQAIAEATIRVARASGANAVTIRAVARELGGSTTLVTNYLPSRTALILNVLDRASARWRSEYENVVDDLSPAERFEALVSWEPEPDDAEPVLRALILEIVANAETEPALRDVLRRESAGYRAALRETAREAGYADPDLASELGYLLLRGSYFANAEDPAYWNAARTREVALSALRALPSVPRARDA
ncbi:TetR/AcrR family transcriptional regulator [Leucobacter tenebrionis]|uniref:TetR/AcrR family transcriptional regulator n=1 Tax=Leucobacter tenebrionis TaxID=2873270 RepID=UPI001CA64F41|nr:TetR family transcriptional regulator C-terminal domain-containing protein [Leucobacter tenebrionis]QZY51699.1 TetR family transcriptional regulator C-terminal domain-containing protein [Leucobacter tenebrionis]